MTKKGALEVTADLDRIAQLFQEEWDALGIPQHIAMDYAKRTDMVSDAIERAAGIDRSAAASNGGWDPEQIGEEVGGPQVQDPDEPYMKGEFTQQENRELRERQEAGDMGPDRTVEEPQAPTPGVQASFSGLVKALKAGKLDAAGAARVAKALDLATTVVRKAGEIPPQFLENAKKKQDEAKEKDEKKDDSKKDESKDEKEGKKKAFTHGYNLSK